MKRVSLVLAALVVQPGGTFVQVPAPCQARLELAQAPQLLTVTVHCQSLLDTPARYRYQLVLMRQSRNGRTQNSQGGEFTLLPSQDLVLSTVRLNVLAHDEYRAQLVVLDLSGHVLARDSASQLAPQR